MANVNAPSGFKPAVQAAGGTIRNAGGYKIASGLAENLYSGDPVRSVVDTDRVIQTALADTTVRILGIFAGVQYNDAAGNVIFSPYWATGTATLNTVPAIAYVFDDPALEFTVQMSTYAAADNNADYDHQMGTGSAVTGRSGASILQTDVTNPKWRVLGMSEKPATGELSELGAFARVRVRAINHERGSVLIGAF